MMLVGALVTIVEDDELEELLIVTLVVLEPEETEPPEVSEELELPPVSVCTFTSFEMLLELEVFELDSQWISTLFVLVEPGPVSVLDWSILISPQPVGVELGGKTAWMRRWLAVWAGATLIVLPVRVAEALRLENVMPVKPPSRMRRTETRLMPSTVF